MADWFVLCFLQNQKRQKSLKSNPDFRKKKFCIDAGV